MNTSNLSIRLKHFLDRKGLTNSQFADQCGIPRPSLSQLLSGRNKKISDAMIGQIHEGYPELSIMWLMFGEGEMFNENAQTASKSASESSEVIDFEDPDMTGGLFAKEFMKNEPSNEPESRMNTRVSGHKTMPESQTPEKSKMPPRRVTQITVYYDDSTFETFFPSPR